MTPLFSFVETELTTHPGQPVTICVDYNGTSLSNQSRRVVLSGSGQPHLGSFQYHQLTFQPALGLTRACFDLAIADVDVVAQYQFGIQNVSGQRLVVKVEEAVRHELTCGVFKKREQPPLDSLESLEDVLFDRFGNYYHPDELLLPTGGGVFVCSAGYFEITFEDGFPDLAMRDVVCDVFTYVSMQIQRRPGIAACEQEPIRVFVTDDFAGSGAAATPFYNGWLTVPLPALNRSIIDCRPFIKINGGIINAFNFASGNANTPAIMDARIDIGLLLVNGLTYFYDWESGQLPSASQADAFTVILHEAAHMLGFHSFLAGNSYFTEWDRFLEASSQPVLSDSYSSLNWWHLDTETLSTSIGTCTQGGGECVELAWSNPSWSSLVKFNPQSGNLDIPILGVENGEYSTSQFTQRFSHLGYDSDSDPLHYLMATTRPTGTALREFGPEDFAILCALGYQTLSCDGCFNVVQSSYHVESHGILGCDRSSFDACVGDSIVISKAAFIENDISNSENDIDVTFVSSLSNDVTLAGPDAQGNYIATSNHVGAFELQYVINSCDYAVPKTGRLEIVFNYCPSCDNDPCNNLLCEDDFQDANSPSRANSGISRFRHRFTEYELGNSPDIRRNEGLMNNYLFMHGQLNYLESYVMALSNPISPGCSLNLSFDAEVIFDSEFVVWGSETPPCSPEDAFIPLDCTVTTDCGNRFYTPVCLGTITIPATVTLDGAFQNPRVQGSFTNVGLSDINYILIFCTGYDTNYDNFIATSTCPADFSYEVDCSTVSFLPDVDAAGFTHSWDFGDGNTSTEVAPVHTYTQSGNYTVTYTLTDECGRQMAPMLKIITVLEGLPDATFTIEETDDCGVFDFISDPNTVGNEHEWYVDDMLVSMDANLTGIILADGDHVIRHVVIGRCGTTEQTRTIEDVDCENCPTPMPGFSFTQNCDDGTITLVADEPGGIHTWDINGDTFTASVVILPIADPNMAVAYTIIHGITNDCGESSNIKQGFMSEPCPQALTCPCEGPNAINIEAGAGTLLSQIPALMGLVYNAGAGNVLEINDRCLAISGRLIIDDFLSDPSMQDMVIFPGEVRMQPGAEIVIAANAKVQIRGTGVGAIPAVLFGCEQMWKGIVVEQGAEFSLTNATVRDAQAAIRPRPNSSIEMRDNVFAHNFVGLYYRDAGAFVVRSYANSYEGGQTLLPPHDAAAVPPLQIQGRCAAGMHITQMGFGAQAAVFIGNDFGSAETYTDLPAGIISAGNVDMRVVNARFENIHPDPTVSYQQEGYGIFFTGFSPTASALAVQGAGGDVRPRFVDCHTAIYTKSAALNMDAVSMTDCAYGVEARNAFNSTVYVTNSDIQFYGTGINLIDNDGASDVRIEKNSLLRTPFNGTVARGGDAIHIEEVLSRAPFRSALLRGNSIYLEPGSFGSGIYARSANNLRIVGNPNIEMWHSSNDRGISLVNCESSLVSENKVYSRGYGGGAPGFRTGLLVQSAMHTAYACNDFFELHTGARFTAGNADGTNFENNYFSPYMFNGLHYEDDLSIDPQQWKGNQWGGTAESYAGSAALNEITANSFFDFQDQVYLVHQNTNGYFPPSVGLPNYALMGEDQPWFVTDGGGTPPLCRVDRLLKPEDGLATDRDLYIAQGGTLTGGYAGQRLWETQKYTYAKLKGLQGAGEVLSNELNGWVQNAASNPVGRYQALATNLKTDLNVGEADALVLDDAWKEKWQQLAVAHDAANGCEEGKPFCADFRAALADLAGINQQLDALLRQAADARQQAATVLGVINNALPTDILPQTNEKTVYDILLKALSNGQTDLPAEAVAVLYGIADQCPLSGGKIVHVARSLYHAMDPTVVFEDDCLTTTALLDAGLGNEETPRQAIAVDKTRGTTAGDNLMVSPNPANNLLEINTQLQGTSRLVIVNNLGNVVYETHLQVGSSTSQVDVSLWPTGLYAVHLTTGGNQTTTQKVVITH